MLHTAIYPGTLCTGTSNIRVYNTNTSFREYRVPVPVYTFPKFFVIAKIKMSSSVYTSSPSPPGRRHGATLPPTVPDYLLADPWTQDDELLLEFDFQNEVSYGVEIRKWERQWWVNQASAAAIPYLWPFLILCGPCSCIRGFPKQKEQKEHNLVQDLWKRRVGISQNGIVYKELVTCPMGADPANACQVAVAAFMTRTLRSARARQARRCPSKRSRTPGSPMPRAPR